MIFVSSLFNSTRASNSALDSQSCSFAGETPIDDPVQCIQIRDIFPLVRIRECISVKFDPDEDSSQNRSTERFP